MIGLLLFVLPAPQDPGTDFFEANIRPLFAEHCTECHGGKKPKAKLRLDSYGSILAGGEGGAVIVPGDVDASRMLVAVRYEDEFLQMPPRNQLPAEKIAKLEEWVGMGAPGPVTERAGAVEVEEFDLEARLAHWAYQPISNPDTPSDRWGRDPLDAFIAERLSGAGLEPASETDRATWLRRVSYGIIGLPPAPAELEAFLADDSSDAYEVVVDRLLSSSHYGEKWARHWLDLVRYGESRGHEFDYVIPNAFEYRDYLTRALNSDVPYDRFVTEHIAGDLVREPRLHPTEGYDESVLGTGFWFLGEEVHSPVDIVKDEADRVSNQIEVFSRTFLAMSVSCARCHDHKFDPIPTEDFYALAGFLHSSSYRQIRFQTDHHNSEVAAALAAVDAEEGGRILSSFAEALEPGVSQIDEYLLAAREVLEARIEPPTGSEELPPGLDIVFEDFEGDSWGAWTTEGDAFGAAPLDLSGIPKYHHIEGWLGNGFVCTHRTFPGESVGEVDAHLGLLKSPNFVVEHDHLHFLVCGGGHAGKTAVNLVVGGEIVKTLTGANDARFRPASFDLSEWRGEEAHIEVVDDFAKGWGNIAVDQFVFSARSDTDALNCALRPEEHLRRLAAVAEVAEERGLDLETLDAWTQATVAARSHATSPLHGWGKLTEGAPITAAPQPANWSLPEDARVLASYGDEARTTPWIQDGNLFGTGPNPVGTPDFGDDPGWPVVGVSNRAAAYVDSTWARLELGFGVEGFARNRSTGWPGLLNWTQAGRTLRTPTFTPLTGRIHYLVRGSGRCFAAIHSHRMIAGPLHNVVIRRFEASEGWRWVTQDLRTYAGHRLHLEFTPVEGASDFAVALVVESEHPPPPPPTTGFVPTGDEPFLLATQISQGFLLAIEALRKESFPEGTEGEDTATWLHWLVRRPELFPRVDRASLAADLSVAFQRRAELLASIQTMSRTAPAMIDGTGVNERVFIRGNHTTPGEVAPRRLPTALPGSEPIEVPGSGRLELAHRLTDPSNPLLARVMANRIWHHLFGRGIVRSVDDFGKQGTAPTHPELLDHLATRFVADGWSMKRLVRDIALSATYRQSIAGDPRGADVDPDNLLLGRAPVRRLEAEAIRDGALAVSGSLDRKLYGPSVPVHLTTFMEGRGRPGESGPVDGKNRRSLYVSVPRNFLSPFFKVFDRPIPFTTQGRRSVSNVPAQSLTMMNDPLFEDLAERWAKRAVETGGQEREEIIEGLYLEAFSRTPSREETERLLVYLGDRDDEAAWADVCHVLFNVKEFIYLN